MKIALIVLLLFFILITTLWRLSSRYPCPYYLAWLVELENPLAKENQAAMIIKHLKLQKGTIVADIGCGPGRLTIPMAHAVGPTGKVLAMDMQSGMLEKIKAKALAQNIDFLQAKIGDNALEKDKYDCALLVNVLGEIPNQELALKEIFNALKPGGILSITETIFDPHFQRSQTVKKLAHSAGFKEKQTFGKWFSYTIHFEA